MQPRQLFGVVVRTLGAVFWFYAASALFHMFAKLAGIALPTQYSAAAEGAAAALYFFLGICFLLGADFIVVFAYGAGKEATLRRQS